MGSLYGAPVAGGLGWAGLGCLCTFVSGLEPRSAPPSLLEGALCKCSSVPSALEPPWGEDIWKNKEEWMSKAKNWYGDAVYSKAPRGFVALDVSASV